MSCPLLYFQFLKERLGTQKHLLFMDLALDLNRQSGFDSLLHFLCVEFGASLALSILICKNRVNNFCLSVLLKGLKEIISVLSSV